MARFRKSLRFLLPGNENYNTLSVLTLLLPLVCSLPELPLVAFAATSVIEVCGNTLIASGTMSQLRARGALPEEGSEILNHMAHTRQSRPDSGLGFQVIAITMFQVVHLGCNRPRIGSETSSQRVFSFNEYPL